jgi:hypothetical protein
MLGASTPFEAADSVSDEKGELLTTTSTLCGDAHATLQSFWAAL